METEQSIINFLEGWRADKVGEGIPELGKLNEAQLGQLAQELSARIDQVSAAPPAGKTTLVAYSDKIGDANAWEVVRELTAGNSRYSSSDVEAGKLFSKAVETALTKATGDPALTERLINGTKNADGVRSPYGVGNTLSMADQVSRNLMKEASGDVLVAVDKIKLDKVFAVTELPALLENPDVTSINGIAKEVFFVLQRNLPASEAQAAMHALVRAGFFVKLGGEVVDLDGGRITLLQRIEKVSGPVDVQNTFRDAAERLLSPALNVLHRASEAAMLITFTSACMQAQKAAKDGDTEEARRIMIEWTAATEGGLVAGAVSAAAVGTFLMPILAWGPWGWAGWTVATVGTGIFVGMVGEEAIHAMFDPFETNPLWNSKTTPLLAQRDDAIGLVFRYALSKLDPLTLFDSIPPNSEALALYNPATGTGAITGDWIIARAHMMAALVSYRAQ